MQSFFLNGATVPRVNVPVLMSLLYLRVLNCADVAPLNGNHRRREFFQTSVRMLLDRCRRRRVAAAAAIAKKIQQQGNDMRMR